MATPTYQGLLFGNEITPEDIKMQETPQFLRTRAEMEKGIDEFKRSTFDPFLEEQFGYVSPTTQLQRLGQNVDFGNEDSIRSAFNQMYKIDPKSAFQWIKEIKPLVESELKGKDSELSTAIKTIREFGITGLGCDILAKPGDANYNPECFKKASKLATDYKRPGEQEEGAIQYTKDRAKAFGDERKFINERARDAVGRGAVADQNLQILEGGDVYFGPGGDLINYWNKLGAVLGNKNAASSAAQAQQFITNNLTLVMEWVKKTKGAISEAEMNLFIAATPNLSQTAAGNRLVLQAIRETARYEQAYKAEFDKWEREERQKAADLGIYNFIPDMSRWNAHIAEWNKTNGIDFKKYLDKAKGLRETKDSYSSDESVGQKVDGFVIEEVL